MAAKAGVVALTRSLAIDHGPNGVRTNAVAPGPVATPLMRRNRTPDEIAYIARQTLVGRVGEPDELAHAIAWLASDGLLLRHGPDDRRRRRRRRRHLNRPADRRRAASGRRGQKRVLRWVPPSTGIMAPDR